MQLPNIKNPTAYARELGEAPDWRIGCIFTGGRHRRHGVARAGLGAALAAIKEAGGGLVEAYPEQVEGVILSAAPTSTQGRPTSSRSSASSETAR